MTNKGLHMVSAQLISLFAGMQNPENRQAGVRTLAQYLKLNAILIFDRDPEKQAFLICPGLTTTWTDTAEWQAFLAQCSEPGMSSANLPDPDTGRQVRVVGLGDADYPRCVLVLVGGEENQEAINSLQILLPFLAQKLADERLLVSLIVPEANEVQANERLRTDKQYQDMLVSYERAKRELSYRREAENKLRVADRRKDEFIATVSHELRTPLNAVLGWAEVLRIKAVNEPTLLKGIDAIIRNAKSQANLISELLDTSSIVAGKLVLHMELVDLKEVIERARETVEPLAQQKNIQIQSHINVKEIVNGDSARLRQVFWNLLCNAVKFTPEGGVITINANSDDHFVHVSITDTGLGIEADFLPYVFDRFRQADASLRRKYGGLGLGLAIAKQFVEMHGGKISVASDGLGLGTSFMAKLPHARTHAFPTSGFEDRITQSAGIDLSGLRILTIDDDTDARSLTGKILQEFGANVEILASSIDVLARIEAERFDILISDIAMPGLDGITLIERIRSFKNADRAKIPAIALTAFSDLGQIRLARAAGFSAVMTKPVSAVELGSMVFGLVQESPKPKVDQ